MIASSSSLGELFLWLRSITDKSFSPFYQQFTLLFLCIISMSLQIIFQATEINAEVPKNTSGFQTILTENVYNDKQPQLLFVFVLLTRRCTSVPATWPETNTECDTAQTEKISPNFKHWNKSVCCRQATNDLTALAMDVVSVFLQIGLLKAWVLVSLPHDTMCALPPYSATLHFWHYNSVTILNDPWERFRHWILMYLL